MPTAQNLRRYSFSMSCKYWPCNCMILKLSASLILHPRNLSLPSLMSTYCAEFIGKTRNLAVTKIIVDFCMLNQFYLFLFWLLIESSFFSYRTVLLLIRIILEYCQCVDNIPSVTTDMLTRLSDLLKVGMILLCYGNIVGRSNSLGCDLSSKCKTFQV